jgi:hypothetical protein
MHQNEIDVRVARHECGRQNDATFAKAILLMQFF